MKHGTWRLFGYLSCIALCASMVAVGCGGEEEPAEDPGGDSGATGGGGGRDSGTDDPWSTSSSGGSSGDGWGNGSSSGDSWGNGSSSGGGWGNGSSSGGSSGQAGGSSSGSSGATCLDPDDAPGTLENAKRLPDTTDRADPVTVQGIMNGRDDIDAYKVYVDDVAFAVLEPVASTTATNLQLCMYAQCNDSAKDISVTCEKGAYESYNAKIKGCCSPTSVELDYKCSTGGAGDDDIQAYIVVKSTAEQCSPYTVTYGF